MSDFNPGLAACQTFNHMFGHNAEVSPVGNVGPSHFGFVNPVNVHAQNPGWHGTTQVGGMSQDFPISVHDHLKNW